jgi:hypothetical protein
LLRRWSDKSHTDSWRKMDQEWNFRLNFSIR